MFRKQDPAAVRQRAQTSPSPVKVHPSNPKAIPGSAPGPHQIPPNGYDPVVVGAPNRNSPLMSWAISEELGENSAADTGNAPKKPFPLRTNGSFVEYKSQGVTDEDLHPDSDESDSEESPNSAKPYQQNTFLSCKDTPFPVGEDEDPTLGEPTLPQLFNSLKTNNQTAGCVFSSGVDLPPLQITSQQPHTRSALSEELKAIRRKPTSKQFPQPSRKGVVDDNATTEALGGYKPLRGVNPGVKPLELTFFHHYYKLEAKGRQNLGCNPPPPQLNFGLNL